MNDVKELLNNDNMESLQLKLKSQKINLEKRQKEIASLDQEIAELLEADAIEKEILEHCEFNASLQETILLITSCLFPKQEANDVEEVVKLQSASPQGSFTAQNGAKGTNKTKLPKLTLPKYTGNATKWTTFSDSFLSAIHTSEDLNEVDKFQYLKSLLEGAAAKTISGSTYSHAVDLLKKAVRKQTIYYH